MRNKIFWIFAILITIFSAIYQRMTGPTYPIRGKIMLGDSQVKYKLARTHGGETDHPVSIQAADTLVTADLVYKRYKTDDTWQILQMTRDGDKLTALLPNQPPAGKLMYRVNVAKGIERVALTGNEPVIIRFKGAVPLYYLVPHVIIMFFAMLLSNKAGIQAIFSQDDAKKVVLLTTILLFLGGMLLGPIVQKFAFGEFWTGFPHGTDLTDNKTAFGMLAWIAALVAVFKSKSSRGWVIAAAIILLAVYLIPHSMFGSELDYSTMQ
jgi:hypothetical protein